MQKNEKKKLTRKLNFRNEQALEKVSTHTDELFDQLKAVIKHWESWLSLGALDVSQLKKWQHWDLHFRASKSFGQEIAKLPRFKPFLA